MADSYALTAGQPEPAVAPDIRVGFILAPKFSLLPFAGFIDCLRHAADEADRSRQIFCRWSVIAPQLEMVQASCGLEVMPQEVFPDPAAFDYLVVVGGLLPWCLELPQETYDYLRRSYAKQTPVVGLCNGSFIMAQAGLLDGRRCAVHFEHKHEMVRMFPKVHTVTDEVYVSDHGLFTCPGGTAPIDLAVALITQHCGKARAVKGLLSLLVDKHRPAHYLPYRPYQKHTECGDWRVEQAVAFMERHLYRPFGVQELAKRLGLSLRELDRAFARHVGEGPAEFWRKIRLAHGHWRLVNSNHSITQISHECGFSDAAHFSRCFKATYGEPPQGFRRRRQKLLTQRPD